MLNGILIQNFKSFPGDARWIPLRRISLILGRNSSGKTTLLQTLLLASQSWRGSAFRMRSLSLAGRHADVGTFWNVLHRGATTSATGADVDPRIRFGFQVALEDGRNIQVVLAYGAAGGEMGSTTGALEQISLYLAQSSTPEWTSAGPGLTFNVVYSQENDEDWSVVWHPHIGDEQEFRAYCRELFGITGSAPDGWDIRVLPERDIELVWQQGKLSRSHGDAPGSAAAAESPDEAFTTNAVDLLSRALVRVVDEVSRVAYVGPLRHRGHRVYAIRTTSSAWRVGATGEQMFDLLYHDRAVEACTNLMLSHDLNVRYRVDLLEASRTSAAAELLLSDPDRPYEDVVGLPDVGTGIAQLLPIVVQCAKFRQPTHARHSLIIEQPELHLHPALQSNLARLFARVISNDAQVIAETHSEHLVLGLGNVIAGGLAEEPTSVSESEAESTTRDAPGRRAYRTVSPKSALVLAFTRRKIDPDDPDSPETLDIAPIEYGENGDFLDAFPGGFFPERMRLMRDRRRP